MLLLVTCAVSLLGQSQRRDASESRMSSQRTRAESGDVKAQVELGIAYASGDGIEKDESEAVKWFRRAAALDDPAGEYSLGEMYLTGRGVELNRQEGAKWIRLAAEAGDPRAQFNLAAMYAEGTGVTKNDHDAAAWMRKAAEQGFAAGQFGLGSMYAHGKGVPENAEEAARWYRKAAEQGDLAAINNLAFLLATSPNAKVRDPREAVVIARKGVEANEDNPTLWDTLAAAYYESGQPAKAVDAERQALVLRQGDRFYEKSLEKYTVAAKH
jgi:TPR repeat protein